MTPHNNVSSLVAGYERVVHIDEDGKFLSRVEYRPRQDGRTAQGDQIPVTHIVHESPAARPAPVRKKVTA